MEKRDVFPQLKRAENVFLKESMEGICFEIKMTEGYAQSTTFDNNPNEAM